MRRSLVLLLLLLALPLAAADIPLSDRPLAPLHVDTFDAAAAPDAVLLAFSSGRDVYVQRLTTAGDPIDETAIYLATPFNGPPSLTVLWDGARWAVVWMNGFAWVERDGDVDGPHETESWYFPAAIDDRIVVARPQSSDPQLSQFSLAQLDGDGEAIPLGSISAPTGNNSSWIIGLDRGLGILSYRLAWVGNGIYNVTASLTGPGGDLRNFFFEMRLSGPAIRFLPSRDGGGLLLWHRDGLNGMIIRPDLSASLPFAIGPAGALSGQIVGTSRTGGWDVLFRPGLVTHVARIETTGVVDVAPLLAANVNLDSSWKLVRTGSSGLLFQQRTRTGMDVWRLVGAALEAAPLSAIGNAAQRTADAARGDGIEIVVWEEQSSDELVLKATRIVGGEPLDGAGLPVAKYGYWTHWDEDRFDVAFDGERFVVAWIEGQQVLARAITAQGEMSDPVRVAEQGWIGGVRIAGGGQGRAAIVWSSSAESWLVPVRSGVPGDRVTIGPLPVLAHTSLPQIVASGDRYLVVFQELFECRITCAADGRVWARAFSLDGEALTEPKRLSEQTSLSPQVVSDGRDFFVTWWSWGGETLSRIGPQLEILWETTLVRRGILSIEDAELRVDAGTTRAAYSTRGQLERFDPLPIAADDEFSAPLSESNILVKTAAHPDRFVIRSLEPHGAADIAIVPTGRIEKVPSPYGQVAWFRVEHRGGAPVTRIELWSSNWIYFPNEPEKPYQTTLVLDRPLLPGASFEVGVGTYQPDSSPSLHVAADAVDLSPANNSAQYGLEERARHRGTRR